MVTRFHIKSLPLVRIYMIHSASIVLEIFQVNQLLFALKISPAFILGEQQIVPLSSLPQTMTSISGRGHSRSTPKGKSQSNPMTTNQQLLKTLIKPHWPTITNKPLLMKQPTRCLLTNTMASTWISTSSILGWKSVWALQTVKRLVILLLPLVQETRLLTSRLNLVNQTTTQFLKLELLFHNSNNKNIGAAYAAPFLLPILKEIADIWCLTKKTLNCH